jgi:toxin ParE1/3/4
MKLRWSRRAEADLFGQCGRIAHDDPRLAAELCAEVLARIGALPEFPYLGRAGRIEGTRELPLPGLPWVAVYEITGETIMVLRLLHGAQNWPEG